MYDKYGISVDRYLDHLLPLIDEIDMIDEDGDDERDTAVMTAIENAGLTYSEFRFLDEKPGYPGYDRDNGGSGWHWKIRRVRNGNPAALSDALRSRPGSKS